MDILEVYVQRRLTPEQAGAMIGTEVGTELAPSFPSPKQGQRRMIYDLDTGELIGIVTRLEPAWLAGLRAAVHGVRFGDNVARHGKGKKMPLKGVTFGYAPPKVVVRQESCRATTTTRDFPDIAHFLDELAGELGRQFRTLNPERSEKDNALVRAAVLPDWRMHEDSLWTSGVINQSSVLPYHRDGNNFDAWSAMPTLRFGMDGGRLHLPEYDLVFPCGDGDVTWFFGKRLVHGVTPMQQRRPDGYRYSVVFYSIQGMKNCRSWAEETRLAAARRTARERKIAAEARAGLGLEGEQETTCIPVEFDVPALDELGAPDGS